MNDYKVKIEVFEGPLDLLLHLVKINEMDIYDVRIAEITEQYLSYLRLMESLDLEIAGDFLVMAATLVNIKLRALLPETADEEDEGEEVDEIEDARGLMEKLIEYRRFKEAAGELGSFERRAAGVFCRDVALPKMAEAELDETIETDLEKLLLAFSRVLRFVDARDWHMVTEAEFSVEEKMEDLEARLSSRGRVDVEEVLRGSKSKLEAIVFLLAMLELFHERRARVEQASLFAPIYLFPMQDAAAAESAEPRPAAEIVELGAETAAPPPAE